jgi:predicted house-cleaning noncanonical NTP pyrophosphatase (MazG superfamily)
METTYTLKITLPKGDILEYTAKDMGHIKSEIRLFKDKYETGEMQSIFEVVVNLAEDLGKGKISNPEKRERKKNWKKTRKKKGIDFSEIGKQKEEEDLEDG